MYKKFKQLKYKIMNSLSTKGKWLIDPSMVGFYLVAFIGIVGLLMISLWQY